MTQIIFYIFGAMLLLSATMVVVIKNPIHAALFLVLSFSSDWRFSPSRSKEITDALIGAKKKVSHVEIESSLGHDSFLFPEQRYVDVLKAFLESPS